MRRAAALILLPIVAVGCSHEQRTKSASPQQTSATATTTTTSTSQQQQRERSSHAGRAARGRAAKPHAPEHNAQLLPWHTNGMSVVVHVRVPQVAVYRSPSAKHAVLVLRRFDARGTPRTFLVRRLSRKWVRVYLPTRPNGSQGWVRRRAVREYTNGYRIVVRLRAHKLHLWRGTKLISTYPVAVGAPATPTPRGLFYITELLKPLDPNGSYGPYSFGLSAHSNVLQTFGGGDGRVGLHGTNEPGLIGSSISHGCIRLRNADVRRLAHILPLGTPVYVRA